ncbi:MAG: hypothetical protein A2X32_00685 [Elusimicrobia bacterium GWC2_64_44]|nr:MAG: hypothetical protein A2X32_00685 [Elusimicrobia bacterium GWC2_64_44]
MPTLLIIDDDADFTTIEAAHFTKQGYRVEVAMNGKDGLAKAAAVKPDIILLDIMMPGMNGIEVLRELEAGEETTDVPVVVMSGKYFDQGMINLFSQEGNCRAFVAKPVVLEQLQRKVEELLGK